MMFASLPSCSQLPRSHLQKLICNHNSPPVISVLLVQVLSTVVWTAAMQHGSRQQQGMDGSNAARQQCSKDPVGLPCWARQVPRDLVTQWRLGTEEPQ
jgi:hypothetical protein